MTEFNKFLGKYHMQIIAAQMFLIIGAVINQSWQERDLIACEAKAGIANTTPPLPKFK